MKSSFNSNWSILGPKIILLQPNLRCIQLHSLVHKSNQHPPQRHTSIHPYVHSVLTTLPTSRVPEYLYLVQQDIYVTNLDIICIQTRKRQLHRRIAFVLRKLSTDSQKELKQIGKQSSHCLLNVFRVDILTVHNIYLYHPQNYKT